MRLRSKKGIMILAVMAVLMTTGLSISSEERHTYVLHDDHFLDMVFNTSDNSMYVDQNISTDGNNKEFNYQYVNGEDHLIIIARDGTDGYIWDYVINSSGVWERETQVVISGAGKDEDAWSSTVPGGIGDAVRDADGYFYYTRYIGNPGTNNFFPEVRLYKTETGATLDSLDFAYGSAWAGHHDYYGSDLMPPTSSVLIVSPQYYQGVSGTHAGMSSKYRSYVNMTDFSSLGSDTVYISSSSSKTLKEYNPRQFAGRFYSIRGGTYDGFYECAWDGGTHITSCTANTPKYLPGVYYNDDPQEYVAQYNDTTVRHTIYYGGSTEIFEFSNYTEVIDIQTQDYATTGTAPGAGAENIYDNFTFTAWEGSNTCGSLTPVNGVTCTVDGQTDTTSGANTTLENRTMRVSPAAITWDKSNLNDERYHQLYLRGSDSGKIEVKYWQGHLKTETGDILGDKIILMGYIFVPLPDTYTELNGFQALTLDHLRSASLVDDDTWTDELWLGLNSTHYTVDSYSLSGGGAPAGTTSYEDTFPYSMADVFWESGGAPWETDPALIENATDTRPLVDIESYNWARVFFWRQINVTSMDSSGTDENKLEWVMDWLQLQYSANITSSDGSMSLDNVGEGNQELYCVAPSGYTFDETNASTLSKTVTVTHDNQNIDIMLQKVKQINMRVHLSTNEVPDVQGASCTLSQNESTVASATSDENGDCVFYYLAPRQDYTLSVNPRLTGVSTKTVSVSTGDYYNSEGYGTGRQCTISSPIEYSYDFNLDLLDGLLLHISPYSYNNGQKTFLSNVRVTVGNQTSVTGESGEAVISVDYAESFSANFYNDAAGLNWTTSLTKGDFWPRYRSGDWYAEVQVPVESMPEDVLGVGGEEAQDALERGDFGGFLGAFFGSSIVWGFLLMGTGAVAVGYFTRDVMGTGIGGMAGFGAAIALGLIPLYLMIMMGLLTAAALAFLVTRGGMGATGG